MMYKKITMALLSISLCLCSSLSSAGAGWRSGSVNQAPSKIQELRINYETMGFTIIFETAITLNCSNPTTVVVYRTTEGYNDMYATALAAFSSGKPVDIYMNGNCHANLYNVGVALSIK